MKDFYKVIEIDEDEFFEKAKGESESLAGFILELAQALPKMGQVISFNSYQFVIESVDRKRIKRVKVILPKSMIRSFKGIRYLGLVSFFLAACNGFVQPKLIGMLRIRISNPSL